MIRAQHVPDFVGKHISEKPLRLNVEMLSTFRDSEIKHADRTERSVFVTRGRRRSQVLSARLYPPYHLRCQDIQYKAIRTPVRWTLGIQVVLFLREWTINPIRIDFGFP